MKQEKIVLGIGYTNSCNMNCDFCYSKDNRMFSYKQPIDVWKKFFDKNGKYIQSINYGTGENVLEDEWFVLIEYIAEKFPDIVQAVTTNGSISKILNEDKKKKKIFLKTISEVDVSLDYSSKDKHNKIRGNNFAYEWALDTMSFCNENGLRLTIVTIGLDQTLELDNIEGIFNIAKKYNAYNRINIYRKSIDREDNCELSYNALMNFLQWASKNDSIVELSDPLFNAIYGNENNIEDKSGVSSFRVVSDGRIYPSTYLLHDDFLIGNIKDENFTFNKKFEFSSKVIIPDDCKECIYVDKCKGGAIDRRILWYKTFNHQDPYCPFLHHNESEYKIFINSKRGDFKSVHAGYLPTLFFKYGS